MNTAKINFSFLLLFLFALFSSNTYAETLPHTDNFESSSSDGWSYDHGDTNELEIRNNGTSTKTYDFGTANANQNVKVTFELDTLGGWEDSGGSQDFFYTTFNDSTVYTITTTNINDMTVAYTTRLTATGLLKISFQTNTSATAEYAQIAYVEIQGIASGSKTICPGQLITELDTTLVTATSLDSGTIPSDATYYYNFTPSADGTLQVASSMNKYSNSLYILDGCSGSTLWTDTGDSNDKSSSEINISANQLIVIAYERRFDSSATYNINFTYTVTTAPVMGDIPNQVGTVQTIFSLDTATYVTGTVTQYTLTGTLPDGLFFNPSTGFISGTPNIETAETSFTITATNNLGTSNEDTFTITIDPLNLESNGGRNFEKRTQSSLFGDVRVIGNTVLCQQNNSGNCIEPTSTTNSNADTNLQKAPHSYSTLTIPTGAVIEYARIYWQGRQAASDDNTWNNTSKSLAGHIRLRKGSGGFTELTADIRDFSNTSGVRIYSASADALNIVDSAGTYFVDTDNFYTFTGKSQDTTPKDGLGAYGAWTLVVIYSDPNETQAKNITIFDGYKQVKNTITNDPNAKVDIEVQGFLTPMSGLVDSQTYVFTTEGDKYINGDKLKMAGTTYNTTLTLLNTASDTSNNAFNSRVDVTGTRSPDLINNNGIDIHQYDTGTTAGAKNIITNNETGAKFQFTSDGDTYFPSLIVFATELYLPQLCYDYSIKQDGHFLDIDRDVYPIAQLDSRISSSPLEITVYVKNKEADIAAEGIAIKADVNDTIFYQVGNIHTSNTNGSILLDRGTPSSSSTLCNYNKNGDNSVNNRGCTNGHDIRKGNGTLKAQDYVYTKFFLQPQNISGISSIDEPLGLSLKYYITADGNKIEYPDYVLGGVNVPLCTPSVGYQPEWGFFNVVQSGQNNNNILNNIYTQISRRPFNVSVVFDSDTATGSNEAPTSDINTTVLVEIIDVDSFGDLNASCANPDANLSEPIFVPIDFTNTNFQTALATQTNDYYNFAVKNAAFRIWHFNRSDGSLIEGWSATTTNNSKTVTSISGLYDVITHTQCATECSSSTSPTCFTCIKNNYAQPICSRDNFSMRPESYDIRIYDINKALPKYDIETDSTNPKNLTKIDLSKLYGYVADNSFGQSGINLSAGYEYRFDINATGSDGLAPVPGYTRYFNSEDDYNASLEWSDPTATKSACNDISDANLTFYVANGVMQNVEKLHDEVGEYLVHVFDNAWTTVDWNATHHSVSNSFSIINDCNSFTSSTVLTNARYGCNITSDHGTDGGGRIYRDQNVSFHPYWFDMNGTTASVGLGNTALNATPFIYMADINIAEDENMSLHLNGTIIALGENNSTLSNYTTGCYAKSLDLNVSKSDTNLTNINSQQVIFQARFHNLDNNDTIIISQDINQDETNSSDDFSIQTSPAYFRKLNNGTLNTRLNINYKRENNVSTNPKKVRYNSYNVACTNEMQNCQFNADLVGTKTTQGSVTINNDVTHYYGRSHSPRYRYTDKNGTAFIYYEVFCNGIECDKTLLQNGINSKTTDDPRWFINENHTVEFGRAISVNQKNAANISSSATTGNHPDSVDLLYNESKGYPYKATMDINSSRFLIYDKYTQDINKSVNSFEVEFIGNAGSWAGVHATDTKTVDTASTKTNRRSMW